jgi:hypothetical protein
MDEQATALWQEATARSIATMNESMEAHNAEVRQRRERCPHVGHPIGYGSIGSRCYCGMATRVAAWYRPNGWRGVRLEPRQRY